MENQTKKISYLEIFKQAFKLTWKNRYLWWFGLFIALSGILTSFNYSFEGDQNNQLMRQNAQNFLLSHPALIIAGLIVFIVIIALFIIIGILGRGALIGSLGEITADKTANFKIGMRFGRKYFWKIFFINLLLGIFTGALMMILATPIIFLFYAKSFVIGTLLGIIALLIFVPILFLTAFLRIFGYLYIVLGKLPLWLSLENAYNLLTKNIKSAIIFCLLFIPITILLGFFAILLLIPVGIVFLIIGLIMFFLFREVGAVIILTIAIAFAAILFLAIKSVYEVFAQAVWLLYFREIAKPEEPEKIAEEEKEVEVIPKTTPIENI